MSDYQGLTSPMGWRSVNQKRDRHELTLLQSVLLRHLRDGATQKEAAAAAGTSADSARKILWCLREKHGVTTTRDLLAVPQVAEQLPGGVA